MITPALVSIVRSEPPVVVTLRPVDSRKRDIRFVLRARVGPLPDDLAALFDLYTTTERASGLRVLVPADFILSINPFYVVRLPATMELTDAFGDVVDVRGAMELRRDLEHWVRESCGEIELRAETAALTLTRNLATTTVTYWSATRGAHTMAFLQHAVQELVFRVSGSVLTQ